MDPIWGAMERAVQFDETSLQASVPQGILASQVQEALAEILISVPFRASKQSQELLRYIVDKSLVGIGTPKGESDWS